MAKPLTLTSENFQAEVLDTTEVVMVDFWASWCGPCKIIAPMVEQLAEQFEGKAKVGKVDVDSNKDLAARYNIRGIPTLLFFKSGDVVDQVVGVQPVDQLTTKLSALLG